MNKIIQEILDNIPALPGIYIMKDGKGRPIYIGKAKSLKSRVASYFQESAVHAPRIVAMVAKVKDLDFVLTKTEVEALILESNFVKKYQPRYNVLLKDDKHYPYLRLTTNENFPRLEIVRKIKKDGGTYFGPYAMAGEVRKTLRLICKIFPLRQSKDPLDGSKKRRPCLNHQMERCLGPCAGLVTKEEYGKMVQEVVLFLKGKKNDLLDLMKEEMEKASGRLEFEKAAGIRDQVKAIRNVVESRMAVSPNLENADVLGYFKENRLARMQVLSIRGWKMMAQRSYSLNYTDQEEGKEVLSSFIKQYYEHALFIPPEIVIGETIPDKDLIETWLTEKKGKKVTINIPMKGKKRFLLRMAEENAQVSFFKIINREEREKNRLQELQQLFSLKKLPRHIEAFDISTTFGVSAVGGLVCFMDGKPDKNRYRRFYIKKVEGIDDYAMMDETMTRHYGRILNEGSALPDLILIDGGKGHLNRAVRTMKQLGLGEIEMVSIAKGSKRNQMETDEFFRPGNPNPVESPATNSGRQFLQSVRDEVHRFSITAHRKLREKNAKRSILEDVNGIGPKRRLALLKHFKGLSAMKKATPEELVAVPGMTEPLAKLLKEELDNG